MGAIICFVLAAVNAAFYMHDKDSWFNGAVAVLCFGVGILLSQIEACKP